MDQPGGRPTLDAANVSAFGPGMGRPPAPQAAAQPTQTPVTATPADALKTVYADAMRNIVRQLDAVARTPADNPQSFRETWQALGSPATASEMHAAIQRIYSLPPQHLAAVFSSADSQTRQYFHVQAMKLAQAVSQDMPELSQASAIMRWVMQQALPALQNLPEGEQLGTMEEVRRNYAALDTTCKIARPDESNPVVVRLKKQAESVAATVQETNQKLIDLRKRMTEAGLDPDAEDDSLALAEIAKENRKKLGTGTIVLIVIVVLLVIAVIVLGVFYAKKCHKPSTPGGGAPAQAALGGHAGLHLPRLDQNLAAMSDEDWGFPSLSHGPV